MSSRRAVLKGLGSALVLGSVTDSASAAPRYDDQEDFVTLAYEGVEDELQRYRPLFDLRGVEIEPTDVYAWKATSTEQDTAVYAYWVWYAAGQRGVSEADSHVPDREPVQVYVDEHSGEVEAVGYDAYHYLYQEQRAPTVYEDTHSSLRIIEPWHPYQPQPDTSYGELLDISSMHEVYDGWMANDWQIHPPAVLNPWSVRYRGHYWADGSLGFSYNGVITETSYRVRETTGFDLILTRDT